MRNIEALRNYFLGKDPQLKETLADNSLRLIGIPGREFVLRAELIRRLKELKDTLDKEDERLQDEIDDLIQETERLDNKFDNYVNILDFEHTLENYYTKQQVDALLAVIPRFSIEVVQELPNPLSASPTTIYLVPADETEQSNYYNEYILVNNSWELVGTTKIDMSDYYTKEEVDDSFVEKSGDTMTGTLVAPNIIVGSNNSIIGNSSMTNGTDNIATGDNSHAEGQGTVAGYDMQSVSGAYNINTSTEELDLPTQTRILTLMTQRVIGGTETAENLRKAETVKTSYEEGVYAEQVGNGLLGTKDEYKSNAYTLDWEGNGWFAGDVYVGSTSGTHKDEGSKKLVTEDEVMRLLQDFATTNGLNMPT